MLICQRFKRNGKRKKSAVKKCNKKNGNGMVSIKEELFIKEYLKDFNATRSYMVAYNNNHTETAGVNGHLTLINTKVLA